jgi:hypothetical protein
MDLISKLERRLGSIAIPHLALYLILLQIIGVVLISGEYVSGYDLVLSGEQVLKEGQWWRLLSFMMMPRTLSPLFLIISFLVFYTISGALERQWGTFRFNLFILCGYLLTILMALLNPGAVLTNIYFLGCVFLAFATLFPNFEFLIFFILPVKVKWLGWLTAGMFVVTLFSPVDGAGAAFILGDKLAVGAAFATYGLFFGKDFIRGLKAGQRRKAYVAEQQIVAAKALHECSVCGATDKTDPHMHFRYCSTCGECFCEEHIGNHRH